MDLQTFTAKFSALYGVDLTEDTNVAILSQVIKKISEEYPKIETSSLVTVALQTRYTVVKDDLIKISRVYYTRRSLGSGDSLIVNPDVVNSDSVQYSLSSQFTDLCERAMYEKLNPVDAGIVEMDSFDLIPTPTVAGISVYYDYEAYRTIDEIPAIFEDDMFRLFFFYERENAFRSSMRVNNGNVHRFDRRGNISIEAATSDDDPLKIRESEFKSIMKSIRNTIMRLKR